MKKIILIVAVLVIALVGLTSYNGKEVKKESGDDRMFAMIKTAKGEPLIPTIVVKGGEKKKE